MRGAKIAVVLAVGALVAGCVRGLVVRIAGPVTAPIFTVSRPSPLVTGRICLSSVEVVTASPGGQAEQAAWRVATEDLTCAPITRIAYGHAPEGFRTLAGATPLSLGVAYQVRATGHGWAGGRTFRFDTPDQARMLDSD